MGAQRPVVKPSGRGTQPYLQVGSALKIQQIFRKLLQPLQRQGANVRDLLRGDPPAAATELAQGQIQRAFLRALLTAFPPALPLTFNPALAEDLLAGHAMGELLQGDAADGAHLRDRSAIASSACTSKANAHSSGSTEGSLAAGYSSTSCSTRRALWA